MATPYRKPGSLVYFVTVDGAGTDGGAREIDLGTENIREALRLCQERFGPVPAAAAQVAPRAAGRTAPRSAVPARATPAPDRSSPSRTLPAARSAAPRILPGSVHHAVAYFLQRGTPDIADATRRIYTQKGQQLVRLLGDMPLADLSRSDLDTYVAKRKSEGVALETVRKELAVLRLTLKLAADLGEFERDPMRVLPRLRCKYIPRRRWLPVSEVQALLAKLPVRRQLWVLVIIYTSARYSEAERLTWEAIDYAGGLVHVDGTKTGGSDRFVPLHPELRRALEPHRKARGVVLAPWKNPHRDLKSACRRAKIDVATFNDLRRTYAS